MAISGSGNWIPSQGYAVNWRGEVERAGSTQNKPRECVMSVEEAVKALRDGEPGTIVNIDVRYGNPAKLVALWDDERLR
jgi:hypothetical protein